MLPVTANRRFNLADVMPSCIAALEGAVNPLNLAAATKVVIVLVDGLGTHPLLARSGHSRVLAPMVTKASTITSRFPTTTASALATLTTGTDPGTHGLVGYSVLDPAHDRAVNQLSGWDDRLDPETWQLVPTLFETARQAGVGSFVVAPTKHRASGFTRAVLRGAQYRGADTIDERFAEARRILDMTDRALVYLYIPELDQTAHAKGNESPEWTRFLEMVDARVGDFAQSLRRGEGMLVTADHGGLDVPARSHVMVDELPGLLDGVRHIAGEPRALQLHLEPGVSSDEVAGRWADVEGGRSWIMTRDEAVAGGVFGRAVDPRVSPRIGDVLVAARSRIAYYDGRAASQSGRKMIGQHGSFTTEETAVPLLRFGVFAL